VPPGRYLVRTEIRNGDDAITELLRDVTVKSGTRPTVAAETPATAPPGLEPQQLLKGDVVRRLIETIQVRTKEPDVDAASKMALQGKWTAIDTTLVASDTSGDACILRGTAAYARADYPAAATAFRAAQDAGMRDAGLSFMLGWAHAAAGDDRSAITDWRNAVLVDSSFVPSYLALVDAYLRLGQHDLAVQVVKSGLTVMPSSPELLDRLARLEDRR
jgi:tetratricopeptide (TPR) repeat protein